MRVVFVISLLLLLGACGSNEPQNPPSASAGFIDLSAWDFSQNDPLELSGEWEFYWSQLLSPQQIAQQRPDFQLQEVPARWTSYDDQLAVEGYATYRLRVQLPADSEVYGLFLDGQGSSFTLWANSEVIAEDGEVGTELSGNVRRGQPQLVFFQPDDSLVELVMQISNFSHRSAGFRNALIIGSADSIHALERNTSLFQSTYLGLLLAIALYHYFLFSQRTEDSFPFHFANLALLVAIRIGFTGNNVLVSALPFLSWEIALRIEYFTFFLITPIFAAMMRSIYPRDVHRWFLLATIAVAVAYSVFTVLTSTLTATYTVPSYQLVILAEMAYFVYVLVRIFAKKRDGRFYFGIATIIGLMGLVSEILFSRGFVSYGEVAPIGIVGFVMVQAIYLAARFSSTFRKVEELSVLLERNNENLQESETKYRTIFEDSKDMIYIADLSGRVEDISPSCKEIFGYTRDEVIRNQINLNEIASKEDRSMFSSLMTEFNSVEDFEFDLPHKDGHKVRVAMNASTRVDTNGRITGILGTVRDITDKLQAREQRLRAERAETIASTDALTNAYTRRYLNEVTQREMARSNRNSTPLTLVILDIDHFKQINDTHGHLAGDKVLVQLSQVCRDNIRSTDVFSRYGGEEFIILMPETSLELGQQKTEVLRKLISDQPLIEFNGREIPVSFSAGVTAWETGESLESLIARADKALYQAKKSGRNQTCIGTD
ncbi:MAG: diguanylate cyclase [Pseudomonadales bacterium]|nr:diguanylate cyclase [Pseudomonadales bacterium]